VFDDAGLRFASLDNYPVMYKRISNENKMRRMTKAVVRVGSFVAEGSALEDIAKRAMLLVGNIARVRKVPRLFQRKDASGSGFSDDVCDVCHDDALGRS